MPQDPLISIDMKFLRCFIFVSKELSLALFCVLFCREQPQFNKKKNFKRISLGVMEQSAVNSFTVFIYTKAGKKRKQTKHTVRKRSCVNVHFSTSKKICRTFAGILLTKQCKIYEIGQVKSVSDPRTLSNFQTQGHFLGHSETRM